MYDVKSKSGALKTSTGRYVAAGKQIKPGQKQYVVQKGDTLYSIAWRAGINVNTLISRNAIRKPYVIKQGQVLQLQRNTRQSAEQQNVKTRLRPAKPQKTDVSACTTQACTQKNQIQVVKKSSKAYSSKNTGMTTSQQKPVKQNVSDKKVARWKWPTQGKLIKTFANSAQGMKGISIANDRGSPIYAAAKGQVVYAGNGLRGYGNLIIIKHNYDYLSAYAHNDKLLIKENTQVELGQKIAEMGDTDSNSVRLHFDIRYRGKSVDPLRYLPKR